MALYTTGPPISLPGTKTAVLRNEKITDGNTLRTWAIQRLAEIGNPEVEYSLEADDIGALQSDDSGFDSLALGELIHIIDADLGIDARVRLTSFDLSLTNPVEIRVGLELRKRDIADALADQVETTEALANDTTDRLDADAVYLDDSTPLTDWATDTTAIDGDAIKDGTIQHIHLAKVTAVTGSPGDQSYTCELLSSDASRTPQGVSYTGCLVADDSATELLLNAEVMIAIPSTGEGAGGYVPLIVSEIATAASGDVYVSYDLISQMIAFSGSY